MDSDKRSVYRYELQRTKVLEIREDVMADAPCKIADFLRGLGFAEKEQEHFYSIFLDTKNKIKGYSLITIGLIDRAPTHAREVFRNAIIEGATRIVLAHNHPSGDVTPSTSDIMATRELVAAGKIIGIEVIDHIIIGQPNPATRKDFLSFREEGLL